MCGIAGYALARPTTGTGLLASLLDGVRERGPEDEGASIHQYWKLPRQRMGSGESSLAESTQGMRDRLFRTAKLRHRPRTYTVHVPERDELPCASAVVKHFGIENTVLTATEGPIGSEAK